MRKLLLILATLCCLSSCSSVVHKMDVEQGNVVTKDMIAQVHLGMTETQVRDILGPPVLANVFDKSRLDYAYTYKPGHGPEVEKSMTLIFKHDRLVEVTGNMYSEFIK